MRSRSLQGLPSRLEAGRQRFERWRGQRTGRTRIPESLWGTAVTLAEEFGVHRTAKALRLNYETLKARVSSARPEPSSAEPPTKFIELLPGTVHMACKCVVELEDGHGARMVMHLEHADAKLLTALASAFVRGAR